MSLAGGAGLALETAGLALETAGRPGRRVRKDQGSAPGLEGLLSAGEASAFSWRVYGWVGKPTKGREPSSVLSWADPWADPWAHSAIAHFTREKVEVGEGSRWPSPAASKWLHRA